MTWDVDSNGQFDALTDGRLILSYLFGFTGEALIINSIAPDATRREAGEIIAYLESIRDELDLDGNGIIDALTDGILYLRPEYRTKIVYSASPNGSNPCGTRI